MPADAAKGLEDLPLRLILTAAQWEECRQARRGARDAGLDLSLREIALKKGFVTADRIEALDPLPGEAVLRPEVPGLEIEDVIGRGGMGTVYRARQTGLGRTAAVKVLRDQFARSPNYVRRFLREAKLAAKLDHPNAVRVFLAGQSGERCYIVMEHVEGQTLRERLSAGTPMDEGQALNIVAQVAGALGQAHRLGIVHRDIKPGNIIITDPGVAKLADLGLSKDIFDGEDLQRTGTTVGTPAYIAPEQARDSRSATARSDIYSLGATLYHMLTGEPMFRGEDRADIMRKQCEEEPTPARERNPKVSLATVAILQRMLAKNSAERYPSTEDLLLDIEQYERERGDAAPDQPSARQRPRLRRTRIAAYLLALAAVVVGVWLYGPFHASPNEMLTKALALRDAGRADEARDALEALRNRYPRSQQAADADRALTALWREERSRQLVGEIEALRADGKPVEALRLGRTLVSRLAGTSGEEDYQKIESALRADAYAKALETARNHIAQGDPEAALRALTSAQAYSGPDSRVEAIQSAALHLFWRQRGDGALAEGKEADALAAYRKALSEKSDADLLKRADVLAAKLAAQKLLTTLVPKIDASKPGKPVIDGEDLAEYAGTVPALWEVVRNLGDAGVRGKHTLPELLLLLHRLGDTRARDELLKLLDAEKPGPETHFAALAYARTGEDAVAALEKRLKEAEGDLRQWLIEALTLIGKPAAGVFATLTGAADEAEATRAITTLGTLGESGARALAALLAKPGAKRALAAKTLAAMGADAVTPIIDIVPEVDKEGWDLAIGTLTDIGPEAVPSLLVALRKGDGKQRIVALQVIGRIGDGSVPSLLAALRDGDGAVRDTAADVLKSLGARAAPKVLEAAGEGDGIAPEVVLALKALGDSAVNGLMDAFLSDNAERRASAQRALLAMGDDGINALVKVAANRKADDKVRLSALSILAGAGPNVVPALLSLVDEDESAVSKRARQIIAGFGDKAVPQLHAALRGNSARVRFYALVFYWQAVGRKALPDVRRALGDKSDAVRAIAVELIAGVADEDSIAVLAPLLRDKSDRVRASAVNALVGIGTARAALVLVYSMEKPPIEGADLKARIAGLGKVAMPALRQAFYDKKFGAPLDVLDVLAVVGTGETVDLLIIALDHKESEVREHTAKLLGGLGGFRAVQALRRRIEDGSTKVRVAVIGALGEIGGNAAVDDIGRRLRYDILAVRLAAVDALANIGGNDAKAWLLYAARNDANVNVRRRAALALDAME